MNKNDALIPVEQRDVTFYDDNVTAVVAKDGTVYVPVKPLCELIGVSWTGQNDRINRDPVLSTCIRVIRMQVGGQGRDVSALPLKYLNGWLFGINANRVKKESVREALIRYQHDCHDVLHEAFSTGIAVRPDHELMQSEDPSAVSFRHLMQMARLAREQYYLTKRVDDHEKRLGLIEAQLSNPAAYVTQEQAQLVSGAVKAIATVLGKISGRNEFGAVYGELYSRSGVTSYKHIPSKRFDETMNWLRNWYIELTDESNAPF